MGGGCKLYFFLLQPCFNASSFDAFCTLHYVGVDGMKKKLSKIIKISFIFEGECLILGPVFLVIYTIGLEENWAYHLINLVYNLMSLCWWVAGISFTVFLMTGFPWLLLEDEN